MNVYLSTAQAKSIVLQLMQIFPEGVSLCDEDGVILSSSDTGRINRTSPLAKQCIEQANSGKPYNERVVDGNVTATPLLFKDVCVGAVLMLGDMPQRRRSPSTPCLKKPIRSTPSEPPHRGGCKQTIGVRQCA